MIISPVPPSLQLKRFGTRAISEGEKDVAFLSWSEKEVCHVKQKPTGSAD